MNKSLKNIILSDDLQNFERFTFKKELGDVLSVYTIDLLNSEDLKCLKYISKYVSLKNFRDAQQRTLLHYAVMANTRACEYLIKIGLDVNALDDKGNTPLDISILEEREDCRKIVERKCFSLYTP